MFDEVHMPLPICAMKLMSNKNVPSNSHFPHDVFIKFVRDLSRCVCAFGGVFADQHNYECAFDDTNNLNIKGAIVPTLLPLTVEEEIS